MSNWVKYPFPELQEAMNWLGKERFYNKGDDVEAQMHRNVLHEELQRLINIYQQWFALQQYQDFIRPRNELAKELFVAIHQGQNIDYVRGDKLEHEIKKVLEVADTFLKVSGEKKKKAEDIEEALREVLGWSR